jgi:hypothetical protein
MPELIAHFAAVASRPAGHPEGGKCNADPALGLFYLQRPQIKALCAHPSLSVQGSSSSDLTPNWFDRIAPLRFAANHARNLKLRLTR